MKHIKMAAAAAAAAVFLGGCALKQEEPWIPDRSAVQIDRDGRVTETIVESLDKSYYDVSELETMVRDSVDAYNAEAQNAAITVNELSASEGSVRLVLAYAGMEDYTAYNKVPFFNGSLLDAEVAGFTFDTTFREVKKGKVLTDPVTSDTVLSHKELHAVVVDGSYAVEVPRNIRYISSNALLQTNRIAVPSAASAEDPDTSGNDHLIYILYDF